MTHRNIIVLGSANMDLVLPLPRLPREGETLTGGDLALHPGGKGANQACAAAKLGGKAVMIAQVGSDPFAAKLIESLAANGVDTSRIGVSARPTGCASIYVLPDGENSIVISPGANATLDVDIALSKLDSLQSGDLLLCQLEIPLPTVAAALSKARAAGATTILDPAPAQSLSRDVLSSVDFLTPNQTEAAALLGRPGCEPRGFEDAAEVARELLSLGPKTVVVKLGSLGCLIANANMCESVPAFPVTAVDSTAAGDVFNAGFAVALAEGKGLVDAAVFASAAAAISVTRPGAQSSVPSRNEVEAFLKQKTGPAAAR
ncbi:MAG TPA: ribokinase [Bryobacteraceae bacterium]|nr:ribokinase [Bryobacteraceae bacterium]HOQ46996.1 ribokinase [Bryobacteraceae bacterium]